MVEFKFKRHYKLQSAIQKTTLGDLRTELLHAQTLMNPDLFDLLKANSFLEQLPEPLRELWNRAMVAHEEAMYTKVITADKAMEAIIEVEAPKSVRIVTEIPKSSHT